jgi:uncharacterized protein
MDKTFLYSQIKDYLLIKKTKKAAIFGSFARNEETEDSDIDLLVDIQGITMFDFLKMEDDLAKITHRKIDMVEYKAIKPTIAKYVYENVIELI